MKKYEFKNYITHKTAEVHLYKANNKITYVVWYSQFGKPDCNPHGDAGCNNGAEDCTEETEAIQRAVSYISRES